MAEASRWVFTICCAVLICGLVSAILPSESMEKAMSLILGLFLLCCFLLPMGVDFSDFRVDLQSPDSVQEETAREATDFFLRGAMEQNLEAAEKEILEYLGEYGIKPDEADIYIDTEEKPSGEWEMIVSICLPERARENHDVIYKALEYKLGTTVRREYAGEAQ